MLIHVAAFNVGLIMRKRFGFGTPRGLQGLAAASAALTERSARFRGLSSPNRAHFRPLEPTSRLETPFRLPVDYKHSVHTSLAVCTTSSLPGH